ncbi:chemotaxis-specific protein-glutamate methyltransferase CheB [Chitinimonas arctica]|uniref:Protein-glutamate methylesterase/protein-glutamine glutaminase n=1 Tax=Chitinimonas arctica TaxID=2594795 RepID=A0A516SEN3_9NEIS|nr:chemotaxis-specific protein-glutamate methyltransferase CheB [Chitinimonas arctica]QDQ26570.1 chemotaxis-specific protein-glutamate methyltransferase CheB [Chitinimonas arctica]
MTTTEPRTQGLPAGSRPSPIRILVVDDSIVVRELLVYILNSDPDLEVVGLAADGDAALAAAVRLQPDVITMDIHMPRMDGFTATRCIMEACPTRIIMVTDTAQPQHVAATFRALEAGALTVLARPPGPASSDFAALAKSLTDTIKLMAEVQVIRRWSRAPLAAAPVNGAPVMINPHQGNGRLVAIGASTGGPLALQAILSSLPKNFPAPIAIVQHISPGFALGFAKWLAQASGYSVRVARQGETMLAGHAYVAPDGLQMHVGGNAEVILVSDGVGQGLRPSVAHLFSSVARAYGSRAIGVLLTGMGCDGAQELLQMKMAGAVTVAQEGKSAVVNGMPGEAVKLGAARFVLTPEEMPTVLCRWADGL